LSYIAKAFTTQTHSRLSDITYLGYCIGEGFATQNDVNSTT